MTNVKKLVLLGLGLFILTACARGVAKNETAVYQLKGVPGTFTSITLEYDKNKHIQKTLTKSDVVFAEAGISKEDYEDIIADASHFYKSVQGVKHSVNFSDDKLHETVEIIVKDVPEGNLPLLFTDAVEDGKVSFDKQVKNLQAAGFTKQSNFSK